MPYVFLAFTLQASVKRQRNSDNDKKTSDFVTWQISKLLNDWNSMQLGTNRHANAQVDTKIPMHIKNKISHPGTVE